MGNQLSDPDLRRKYGLAPLPGMAPADDMEARRLPDFPLDSDWVTFEAVIGTSADQTALAPGASGRVAAAATFITARWGKCGTSSPCFRRDTG